MNADRDLTDRALDELVRAHSGETPPAHVDAAILAAAHRAVGSTPRSSDRALAKQAWRWWMPVAAAAVIGVVVIGVLPLAPTVLDDTSPIVSDAPVASRNDAVVERRQSAAAETNAPRAGVAQKRAESMPPRPATPPEPFAAAQDRAKSERKASATPSERPVMSQPPAAPPQAIARDRPPSMQDKRAETVPAPGSAVGDQANAGITREQAQANAVRERAAVGAASEQSADAALRKSPGVPGEHLGAHEWIERIQALRSEGKPAEALRELARFRRAYPDADSRLPPELRAWAAERS